MTVYGIRPICDNIPNRRTQVKVTKHEAGTLATRLSSYAMDAHSHGNDRVNLSVQTLDEILTALLQPPPIVTYTIEGIDQEALDDLYRLLRELEPGVRSTLHNLRRQLMGHRS